MNRRSKQSAGARRQFLTADHVMFYRTTRRKVFARDTEHFPFLTRECAHAHERVIAIVDFSLGRSVGWFVRLLTFGHAQ